MSRPEAHTHVKVWALCATETLRSRSHYGMEPYYSRTWIKQWGKGKQPAPSIRSALKWLTREEAEAYMEAVGLTEKIVGPREVSIGS